MVRIVATFALESFYSVRMLMKLNKMKQNIFEDFYSQRSNIFYTNFSTIWFIVYLSFSVHSVTFHKPTVRMLSNQIICGENNSTYANKEHVTGQVLPLNHSLNSLEKTNYYSKLSDMRENLLCMRTRVISISQIKIGH